MSTFVLVHGAWQDGTCWREITPRLQAQGHQVIAPDLPGHGADATPVSQVSLPGYVESVVAILDGQSEPVILVGHSMAGMVISGVAEARPDKITRLVYLAAYLAQDGETILQLAQQDSGAILGPYFIIDQEKGTIDIQMEGRLKGFFNDVDPTIAATEAAKIQPEPLAPFATPVHVTAANFGRVERVYIHTQQDLVVSPILQGIMVAATPCKQEIAIDAGHAAFLSQPAALATILNGLA